MPLATAGAELADQFLLLGIDRHHRLSLSLKRLGPPVDVLELGIPVRVALAFERLAVGLETIIVQGVEQPVDRAFANGMPAGLESAASLAALLHVHCSGDMGSPRVTGSTRISKSRRRSTS